MRRLARSLLASLALLAPLAARAQQQEGTAAPVYLPLHNSALVFEGDGTVAGMQKGIALDKRARGLADGAGAAIDAAMITSNIANAYAELAGMEKTGRRMALDSAVAYAGDASRRARAANFPAPEIEGLWAMGRVMYVRDLPDSAIGMFQGAADVSRIVHDTTRMIHSYWLVGDTYVRLGRMHEALPFLRAGSIEIDSIADRRVAARRYHTMVVAFRGAGLVDSALAYGFAEIGTRLTANDTSGAGLALLERGEMFVSIARLDSAAATYDDAVTCFAIMRDTSDLALAHLLRGGVLLQLGGRDSALTEIRLAYTLARAAGDLRGEVETGTALANVFLLAGVPDSARAIADSAVDAAERLKDPVQLARALIYSARTRLVTGDLPAGALATRRAAAIAAHATPDSLTSIELAYNIATVFLTLGRVDSATVYAQSAIAFSGGNDALPNVDLALMTLGTAQLVLGRADSAIVYLRRSADAIRAGGKMLSLPEVLSTLSRAYLTGGRRAEALAVLDTAAAIASTSGIPAYEARIADERGMVLADSAPDEAAREYERAIALYASVQNRTMVAGVMEALAILVARHDADSALALLRTARPLVEGSTDEAGIVAGIATVLQLRNHPGDLASSSAAYDTAMALFEASRRASGSDENRVNFSESAADLFGDWALVELNRAAERGAPSATRAALAVIERGRARGLRDLRGESAEVRPGADLPAEGAALLARLRASPHPVAMVAYAFSSGRLLVFAAGPDGAVVASDDSLPRDTLDARVRTLRRSLGVERAASARGFPARGVEDDDGDPTTADRTLRALAVELLPRQVRALLASLTPGTEVVVLPQGALNVVPFAALPFDSTTLGARFALRFAPSLEVATLAPRPGSASGAALVVGNPTMPSVALVPGDAPTQLASLPGARAEAMAVATQLHTTALLGANASLDAVTTRLPSARIVHLATHGYAYADEAMSRMSFIAFAPGHGSSGLLTVGDVLYSLPPLTADLVVLSACQSGLGQLRSSEGTVGLQRAFLARGARNVLVSLWSVSDEATELLMTRFYAHWLGDADHPGKAEALRRAEGEVRANPKFASPVYWAAFQLVGAG